MRNIHRIHHSVRQHPPMIRRIKQGYQRSPFLLAVLSAGKQLWTRHYGRWHRRGVIRAYLRAHPVPKLHVGAGPVRLPGWLDTDLKPRHRDQIYLDAGHPFPFADGTFRYIYTEHMIDYLTFRDCISMLQECRRVLQPGGHLRISTADLQVLADLYQADPLTPEQQAYVDWYSTFFFDGDFKRPAFVVGSIAHTWKMKVVHDAETLTHVLQRAGFTDIRQVEVGQSEDPHLADVERHGTGIGEAMNRFETMVFEARRPEATAGSAL